MKITFYGVRGSIPSPGPDTSRYGGNTSCVHIETASGQDLVLDAGTGIRNLGKRLIEKDSTINILMSHGHWDHIQGYPFFMPIYQPDRHIRVFTSTNTDHGQIFSLFDQIDGATFPVKANELPSRSECITEDFETQLAMQDICIQRMQLNHPGGGYAYRIEENGASCAYITDNELEPPEKASTTYDQWVEFCHGVDVLIHDAQYLESDMPHKHGWGHSLVSQVRQLAVDAEVGCLVMFHHDPDRTDTEIDFIQKDNDHFFRGKRAPSISLCAAENMQIKLTAQQDKGTLIEVGQAEA
ncbi:MAG: MBL fold metallo-hydrolase [Gammaproteobacteria bacterium]|nr:MBL fold metallo-hydrolase [Gammaproteobacteria bacterium]